MKRLANIELTNNCKADCSMCPRDALKVFGFIDLQTVDDIVEHLQKYDLSEVSISGRGEPTFHPQLIEILKRLKKLDAPLSLVTTTDGLNERNLHDCLDNLDILRISVSSRDRDTFKKVHRGLNYDKIWHTIEQAIEYDKDKLNIHLVGGQDCFDHLEETIDFFKDRGVKNIHIFPLWNRGGDLKKEQDINEKRKRIVEQYQIDFSEDEYMDGDKVKLLQNPSYCPIGDSSIMVNYKGQMIGCFQDFANRTIVGYVKDKDLNFVAKRGTLLSKMPVCKDCNSRKAVTTKYEEYDEER